MIRQLIFAKKYYKTLVWLYGMEAKCTVKARCKLIDTYNKYKNKSQTTTIILTLFRDAA